MMTRLPRKRRTRCARAVRPSRVQFCGAVGKSGIPVHVWLPDAWKADAGECAHHAATMVAAGVFSCPVYRFSLAQSMA